MGVALESRSKQRKPGGERIPIYDRLKMMEQSKLEGESSGLKVDMMPYRGCLLLTKHVLGVRVF